MVESGEGNQFGYQVNLLPFADYLLTFADLLLCFGDGGDQRLVAEVYFGPVVDFVVLFEGHSLLAVGSSCFELRVDVELVLYCLDFEGSVVAVPRDDRGPSEHKYFVVFRSLCGDNLLVEAAGSQNAGADVDLHVVPERSETAKRAPETADHVESVALHVALCLGLHHCEVGPVVELPFPELFVSQFAKLLFDFGVYHLHEQRSQRLVLVLVHLLEGDSAAARHQHVEAVVTLLLSLLLLGPPLPIQVGSGAEGGFLGLGPDGVSAEGDHLEFPLELELDGVDNSVPRFGGIGTDRRHGLHFVDEYFFAWLCSKLKQVSQIVALQLLVSFFHRYVFEVRLLRVYPYSLLDESLLA